MEHSLVCSVERGGEGLGLFKATNKLVGKAPVNQGAFWERRMADPMACLQFCLTAVWQSGVKEVKVRRWGFWCWALEEGFGFVFIETALWAPGPCAILTQKSAGFTSSKTPWLT